MPDVEQKEIDALQAEINKIDFDGGPAPAGVTPAASTQDPPADDLEGSKDEPTPEPDPQPEPQPEPEPVDEPEEGEPEPTQDADDAGEEDDKPALSDSHYRAALRMGMTAEEVSELYDKSPELAAKTLAKCHEMVNATSKQLGQLGMAAQKAQAQPEPTPQQPADAPKSNRKIDKLIERVRDHYDGEDDPMADVLLELLKDRQPVQQPVQPEPQQPVVPARTVDEEVAARQQINTFFGADDMTAYSELYGETPEVLGDWSHLTPGQRANRVEVCERAQILLYGAAAAGMEMSTAEAMERAHLEVAAPMAEQIVRRRIAKSAKRRERGLTLQPNANASPDRSGDSKYNKDQAVDEMAAKLNEVFA